MNELIRKNDQRSVDTAAGIFEELSREAESGRQSKDPERGRQATLNRLKMACDALEGSGVAISGAGVENFLGKRFGIGIGPKAQSIANEKGRSLGLWHYLLARQREQKGLRPRGGRKLISSVIDEVSDPDQRDRLRALHAESELNLRKFQRARALFSQISPGVDFDKVLEGWGAGNGPIALPGPRDGPIPGEHLKALERAIAALTDPIVLDRCGLRYDGKRVERKGGTGEALLGLGVVSGLVALHKELIGTPLV